MTRWHVLLWAACSFGAAMGETLDDACDPSNSAKSLLLSPLRLPGCDEQFDTETALLASSCLADAGTHDGSDAACRSIRRQWWQAARALEKSGWLSHASGRQRTRHFAQAFRAGAAEVVALVLRGGSAAESTVVPAVQWAQSKTAVAVLVRFSPKKHGPVSVANVDEPEVTLNGSHVSFRAAARGKPLRFELEIELWGAVVEARSSYSLASAGRLTFQLSKEREDTWPALAAKREAEGEWRGHVGTWYEMQEMFDNEKREAEKAQKEAATAAEKAQKEAATAAEKAKVKANTPSRKTAKGSEKAQSLLERIMAALRRWWRWLRGLLSPSKPGGKTPARKTKASAKTRRPKAATSS